MIRHVSLPARHPEATAETLAKILGGEAMPFPVIAGAWIAWASDGTTEFEVIPDDQAYTPNPEAGKEPVMVPVEGGKASGWHVAVDTKVPAAEIVRLARAAGWPAEICDRAGYFHLVEVWVDGCTCIEILDPEMLERYQATFDAAKWKAMLEQAPFAEEGRETIETLRTRMRGLAARSDRLARIDP